MVTIRSLQDFQGLTWTGGEMMRSLTDGANLFLFSYSIELQSLTAWSSNANRILGVKDSEIITSANIFLRYAHNEDHFRLVEALEKTIADSAAYNISYRWIRPDNNKLIWLHSSAVLIERDGINLLEGVILDISSTVSETLAHVAGPENLTKFLSALPDIYIILDNEGRFLHSNQLNDNLNYNFGDFHYRPQKLFAGQSFWQIFSENSDILLLKEQTSKILNDLQSCFSTRICHAEHTHQIDLLPIKNSSGSIGLIVKVSDITESVRQEQKINELKQNNNFKIMVSGIAHNFNNTLQSIIGHAIAIRNHNNNKSLVKQSSSAIIDLVSSASEFSKQLYDIDRKSYGELCPVDLNLITLSAINKVENLLTSGIKVALAFGNLVPALSNPDKLQTGLVVLINSIANSLRHNETLKLSTFQQYSKNKINDASHAVLAIKLELPSNTSNVVLLPKSRRMSSKAKLKNKKNQKLNSFCTKEVIALFDELNVVLEYSEAISEIYVKLPIFQNSKVEQSSESNSSASTSDAKSKPEILIIDDDKMVLETVTSMVRDIGYTAVTANDEISAIGLIKKYKKHIRLALVDAIMPGTSGVSLIKNLLIQNKNLNVIVFSGAGPESTDPMLSAGAQRILAKPVGIDELRECLKVNLGSKEVA